MTFELIVFCQSSAASEIVTKLLAHSIHHLVFQKLVSHPFLKEDDVKEPLSHSYSAQVQRWKLDPQKGGQPYTALLYISTV